MNDGMRSGRHAGGGRVTGDALKRLIEEGRAESGGGDDGDAPLTDAALRDLAAALSVAAAQRRSPSKLRDAQAQEAAAVAAFREARAASGAAGGVRRRTLRDHLARARTAVLAGVAVTVLGGGAAIAAAGGELPLFGGGSEAEGLRLPARASPGPGPVSSAAPSRPATQAHPSAPSAPARSTAPDGVEAGSADGSDGSGQVSPGGPGPDAGTMPQADDAALRSLCTAHARDPRVHPRALVDAAGGTGRVDAYCEALLATSPPRMSSSEQPGGSASSRSGRTERTERTGGAAGRTPPERAGPGRAPTAPTGPPADVPRRRPAG